VHYLPLEAVLRLDKQSSVSVLIRTSCRRLRSSSERVEPGVGSSRSVMVEGGADDRFPKILPLNGGFFGSGASGLPAVSATKITLLIRRRIETVTVKSSVCLGKYCCILSPMVDFQLQSGTQLLLSYEL